MYEVLSGPRPWVQAPFAAVRRRVNGLKTVLLLATLGGVLVAAGSLFGRTGALLGLLAGVALAGGSWWCSDRVALAAARAVPADPWRYPQYHRMVRELCAEAGLPMPRLYVTPDRQPNAFATGRDPEHAAIAVTQGLLDLMSPAELRAVLAHELAHVGNRDILLTSIAAALATGISALANMLMWIPVLGSDEDEQPGPLTVLATALLAPVAAGLLQLAVSRSREYEADATGARLLGEGVTLARALAKLDRAVHRVPMHVEPAQAAKYVVNPLARRQVDLTALFATHPPIPARIARLTRGAWRA